MKRQSLKTIIEQIDQSTRRQLIKKDLRLTAIIAVAWIMIFIIELVVFNLTKFDYLGYFFEHFLYGNGVGLRTQRIGFIGLIILFVTPFFVLYRLVFIRINLAGRVARILLTTNRIKESEYQMMRRLIRQRVGVAALLALIVVGMCLVWLTAVTSR